jgi:ubiquitin-protein ligase
VLQNQWSPIYDVWSILTAVRLLIANPNTSSPANCIASSMYCYNKTQYEMKVRELVEKSLEGELDEEEEGEVEKVEVQG